MKVVYNRSSSHNRPSKKLFLKNFKNSQENTFWRVPLVIKLQGNAAALVKNNNLTQVFSCEFCEVFDNNLFTEHLQETASD